MWTHSGFISVLNAYWFSLNLFLVNKQKQPSLCLRLHIQMGTLSSPRQHSALLCRCQSSRDIKRGKKKTRAECSERVHKTKTRLNQFVCLGREATADGGPGSRQLVKTWRMGRAKMAELIKLKEIREFTMIGHVRSYRGWEIECSADPVWSHAVPVSHQGPIKHSSSETSHH